MMHLHVWEFKCKGVNTYIYKCIVQGCNEICEIAGFTNTSYEPDRKVL